MNQKVDFLKFFFESGRYSTDRDVTEQIVDLFPAQVFVYDPEEEEIVFTNLRFRQTISVSGNSSLKEIFFPQDLSLVANAVEVIQPNQNGKPLDLSIRLINGDQYDLSLSAIDIESRAQVLFIIHEKASVVNFHLLHTDAWTQQSEELMKFGSWSWAPGTQAVTWTHGIFNILGYQANTVEPSFEVFERHLVDDYKLLLRRVAESVVSTDAFEVEFDLRSAQGEVKRVSCKGRALKEEGGERRFIGVLRDLSDLKKSEREQRRQIEDLNRSNTALEEFAYVASHDLQEPLRKISMFTERLKSRASAKLDEEENAVIDRIISSTSNMKALIDNLLEFTRISGSAVSTTAVDLNSAIKEVLATLELRVEETGANIKCESLPTIQASRQEMIQLFTNLLLNALKFRMPGRTPEIQIMTKKLDRSEKARLGLHPGVTYHEISVRDNGIGFEQEYASRIFEIFQRLNGKSQYPGTGIGLAICKKIVINHEGRIWATGAPGNGASFFVILPENQLS